MKTSNKILIGFLILVLVTPVFLFMSFRNKIAKGEFTVSAPPSNQYRHAALLAPFKVVRIVGPGIPGVLSCHLFPADSSSYVYNNYSNDDSIKIERQGDTLLLKYMEAGLQVNDGNVRRELINLRIDLHAPVLNNVVVEGAGVVMDTVNTTLNPEIHFNLRDQAFLSLGKNGQVKTTQVNNTTVTEMSGALFNKVVIMASASRVDLGQFANISDLNLQLQGASTLSLHNNSQIDHLNGFFSDSSTVEANWKNVRRLAALTNQ